MLIMKRYLLLFALSLASVTFGQGEQGRIGEIEFYGYAGLDLARVRAALPVREGDLAPTSPGAGSAVVSQISEAVRQATGRAPTDVAQVCCNDQGNWMIYVGLPGNSIRDFQYNPVPGGTLQLPSEVVRLYDQTMDALSVAVQNGGSEDRSRGYSLSSNPTLRAEQLATREYALRHGRLLRQVLERSQDDQ